MNPIAKPAFWTLTSSHPLADCFCSGCGLDRTHVHLLHVHQDEWMCCYRHRIKVLIGSNLLSSWQHQTERDWAENAAFLETCDSVRLLDETNCPPQILAQIDQFEAAEAERIRLARDQQHAPTSLGAIFNPGKKTEEDELC